MTPSHAALKITRDNVALRVMRQSSSFLQFPSGPPRLRGSSQHAQDNNGGPWARALTKNKTHALGLAALLRALVGAPALPSARSALSEDTWQINPATNI